MIKALYKAYFWIIAIPFIIVITFITATTVIIGCILGGERFFSYYPGMIWARLVCILTLCPVTVKGRENIRKRESCVFVSNHQGVYDIFALYGYLGARIKWMMKKGLEKIPFVGYACRMAGFIFVDNSSARNAQKSISEAERNLQRGRSFIIFPEGSRTPDGRLKNFKRGAYQIAVDLQLPIIPITINGSYKVMRLNSPNIHPHRIEVVIHPPVLPHKKEENNKEKLQNLVNLTQEAIFCALWDEFK